MSYGLASRLEADWLVGYIAGMSSRLTLPALVLGLALASSAPASAQQAQPRPLVAVASAHLDSILTKARTLVGLRYRWGGSTPETGLDCSGLLRFLFAQAGIDVPHSSRSIATLGEPVEPSLSAMRPGDILHFSTRNRVRHVALYVGNGMIVHASNRKRGIVLDTIPERAFRTTGSSAWRGWSGVRRIAAPLDSAVSISLSPTS